MCEILDYSTDSNRSCVTVTDFNRSLCLWITVSGHSIVTIWTSGYIICKNLGHGYCQKVFETFENLEFQTEKHGSHRMCLTASQLPTAKATGSSWCMVCIEPTDSERVQPSHRKCKLVRITNSSKEKQRAVKTLTFLESQDT